MSGITKKAKVESNLQAMPHGEESTGQGRESGPSSVNTLWTGVHIISEMGLVTL